MRQHLGTYLVPVVVVTAGTAFAQDDLEQRVIELEKKITALEKENSELRGDIKTLARGIVENSQGIAGNAEAISTTSGTLDSHRQAISAVEALAQENRDRHAAVEITLDDNNKKLRDISRYDGAADRYVPRFLGNMQQSQSFRSELRRLNRSMIRVFNPTGQRQPLYINGVKWRVTDSQFSYAPVPLGRVTIQRPGYPKIVLNNWRFDDRRGGYVLSYEYGSEMNMGLSQVD